MGTTRLGSFVLTAFQARAIYLRLVSAPDFSLFTFHFSRPVTRAGQCLVLGLSFHLRSLVDALELGPCQFLHHPMS